MTKMQATPSTSAVLHPLIIAGSLVFSLTAFAGGVPATGQADCFDGSNMVACTQEVSPAMSYTVQGACIRDNITGLVWETKTTDGGMRDVNHRYAWFSQDPSRNGGFAGSEGTTESCGNTLGGQTCNTASYVAAVNAVAYCGASDWRVPTQGELATLIHAGRIEPSIDITYFPHTANSPYWSANTHAMYPERAWGVHFGYGAANAENKFAPLPVRLVRGTWSK